MQHLPSANFNSSFMAERTKVRPNVLHRLQENSYHDLQPGGDRTGNNRTPLLENYQNQNAGLSRGAGAAGSNSTSVPRPTIASELKLLREARATPQPTAVVVDDGKGTSQQFLHNNNLASFMWNREGSGQEDESHREGQRAKREFNIHDGSTNARPLTRSNQRRPVSRQVNPMTDAITNQKLLVQQQMRNTHFGDGGFGFGAKFKSDISLDSERKISRKRGQKLPQQT